MYEYCYDGGGVYRRNSGAESGEGASVGLQKKTGKYSGDYLSHVLVDLGRRQCDILFLLSPLIERNLLQRLVGNDAAIFALGLFFGVFIVDVAHSVRLIEKLRRFANENDVIVKFENIKAQIRLHHEETAQKYHFFRPFSSDKLLAEHLKEMLESFETRRRDDLEKIRNRKEKR